MFTETLIRAKLHAEGLNAVKFVRIDVTDLATIKAAKEAIDQEDGKLDVLVNNAGTVFFLSVISIPIYKLL